MIKVVSITIILAFSSFISFGQLLQNKKPRFLAKIEDKGENFILTGALYGVSDSTVILTCSSCKAAETERFQIVVSVQKIDEITIYRNSRFYNWLFAGWASGTAGFILAYLKYEETGKGIFEPGSVYLATVAAVGALPFVTAGIIRSVSVDKPIIINKDLMKFSKNKESVKKYSFVQ